MTWTTPMDWVDNSTPVNAVNMNAQLRDNLKYLKAEVDALKVEQAGLLNLRPFAERANFGAFTVSVNSQTNWTRLGVNRYFQLPTQGAALFGYAIAVSRTAVSALKDFEWGMEVNGSYYEGVSARSDLFKVVGSGDQFYSPKDVICLNYVESLSVGITRMYPVVRNQLTGTASYTFSSASYFVFFGFPIPTWSDITT